jgi:hypothetical protein
MPDQSDTSHKTLSPAVVAWNAERQLIIDTLMMAYCVVQ